MEVCKSRCLGIRSPGRSGPASTLLTSDSRETRAVVRVHLRVCPHVCVSAGVYTCVCVCVHVSAGVCQRVSVCLPVHMYMHVCAQVCVCDFEGKNTSTIHHPESGLFLPFSA